MTNPYDIIDSLITQMRAVSALASAVGGDTSSIFAYKDAYPQKNNLSLAIHQMPSPSIMVAWQGSGLGSLNQGEVFKHRFSIYMRAGASSGETYPAMLAAILDGVPSGGSIKLINLNMESSCYSMEVAGELVRQADAEEIDYFELPISFSERWQ